ncbi:hypothetical protein BS47DRAFT_1371264 [Hydnum rufescens UP504]|uniref:DNA-directed RNA polymerase III subunit RPC8 n=1 Tax=Hydnum rufescens UP504 TaxID=1448309 RepID=A0A9P6B525_9AGAM|nr:hypothetical protein BS47DRAFT_1371264 [Hydnum rufescens UP504]
MFQLAVLKDTIPVHPNAFGVPPEQALLKELNKKYANRVVFDVGLAICVFDLTRVGDGVVHFGDGCLWYKATFRLVVFRPFASEVILAKVKSSSEDGIRLSIGFFDDMIIPPSYLPSPSAFDPNEQLYFWNPNSDSSHLSHFSTHRSQNATTSRQANTCFHDDEPGPPMAVEGIAVTNPNKRPPYTLVCSIAEQGLGLLAWWDSGGQDEEEQGDDAMQEDV